MSRIQADLAEAKALPFVSSISVDEVMVECVIDGAEFTIMLADEYPAGEPALFGDITASLRSGKLADLCQQVHDLKSKGGVLQRVASSTGEELFVGGQTDDVLMRGTATGGDPEVNSTMLKAAKKVVEEHMADPKLAGKVFIWYEEARCKWMVRLAIPLKSIFSKLSASAFGLDYAKTMVVELQWSWMYFPENDSPEVKDVFMCDHEDLNKKIVPSVDRQVGALKWYLENRMRSAINKNHLHLDRKRMGIDDGNDKAEGMAKFAYLFPEEDFYLNNNKNILVGMYACFAYRLKHCTERCVICDSPLEMQTMKTSVCEKTLCVHSSESYGLGTDLLTELKKHPQICELLFQLTYYTCCTGHQSDRLNPAATTLLVGENYPDYKGPLHFYRGEYCGDKKDFDLLKKTIEQFPKVGELLKIANGDPQKLRDHLNAKNPLVFPLMRWVISSSRVHLEAIPEKLHVPGLNCKHQFHLVSSNPAKEAKFRALKEEMQQKKGKGSTWVWHGSAASNWHCILRLGLKNYSGTKFMSHAAAFGSGIYTACKMGVSIDFMGSPVGRYPAGEHMPSDNGWIFICLCELINWDDKKGLCRMNYHDGSPIVTVQDEDLISTRFVFAYPGSCSASRDIMGDDVKIPKELLEMI